MQLARFNQVTLKTHILFMARWKTLCVMHKIFITAIVSTKIMIGLQVEE